MVATLRTLSEDEAHKFLQFLRTNYSTDRQRRLSVRNYVMACLMLESGARVGELVQLRVHHLWFGSQPVSNLIITSDIAKNKIMREIPVSNFLNNAIRFLKEDFWLETIPDPATTAFSNPYVGHFLTTRQVERIINFAGMKSLNRPVNPHMLRHTFATRLSRVTSIRTVQLLLGHSNLSSTQIYTHPDSNDMRLAIDALHNDQSAATSK